MRTPPPADLGSLAYTLTPEDVLAAFSPFGTITALDMPNDELSGHHKGFAFIVRSNPSPPRHSRLLTHRGACAQEYEDEGRASAGGAARDDDTGRRLFDARDAGLRCWR